MPGPAEAPAFAAPGSPDVARLDATARRAQAEAEAAARRVDALTAQFDARSTAAAEAADRLATAFAVSAEVDRARDATSAALRAAEVAHAARIRAVYADGAAALAVTVLAADDADDVLWRASTVDRIQADLLRRSSLDLASAGTRAARSAAAARVAAEADARLAAALRTLQDDATAADEALARARTALARLDRTARSARAATEAAARLAAAEAAANERRLAQGTTTGALGIPLDFERQYRAAAPSCPGMDWTLLAAVGQVESGHGRNNGPSSAGAIGPMQFLPRTFEAYAVDGDRDGTRDPWSAPDAIWTAARYLCDRGADEGTDDGVHRALFAYNHAQWYVDLVLDAQRAIRQRAEDAASGT